MKKGLKLVSIILFALLFMPMYASAVTLDVVGGQLMSAFDVDVNGNLYDVSFQDGTCIALFDGCNEASDFIFGDSVAAGDASMALMTQVFIDGPYGMFDTNTELTNGIEGVDIGKIWTPWGFNIDNTLNARIFANDSVEAGDSGTWSGLAYPASEFIDITDSVYAVWTESASPVPEPSTMLLLGSGLIGLVVYRKRQGRDIE